MGRTAYPQNDLEVVLLVVGTKVDPFVLEQGLHQLLDQPSIPISARQQRLRASMRFKVSVGAVRCALAAEPSRCYWLGKIQDQVSTDGNW